MAAQNEQKLCAESRNIRNSVYLCLVPYPLKCVIWRLYVGKIRAESAYISSEMAALEARNTAAED